MSKILYFAYGSNMKAERMSKRISSAKVIGRARIIDKRVSFNKKSDDGSGKANLVDAPSNVVWGVVFQLEESEIPKLDNTEKGYVKHNVSVVGDDRTLIQAFTYVASKTDDELMPYDWYVMLIIQGAEENHLPKDYIEALKKVASKPDPKRQK